MHLPGIFSLRLSLDKSCFTFLLEREVLASKICRCFDCHQVLYEQGMFENEPVSISKIMTSQRYSLVTYAAYDVYCTNRDWNTLDKILELDEIGRAHV